MPVSSIDYEKVDMKLLSVLQMISALEYHIASIPLSNDTASGDIILALDKYRNEVSMEIEKQGAR